MEKNKWTTTLLSIISGLLALIMTILGLVANITYQERKDNQTERKEFRELIYLNSAKNIEQDVKIKDLEDDNLTIKQKLGGL